MARLFAAIAIILFAVPAQAADQNYKVYLGGRELGWFRYSGNIGKASISSLFDNTPFGVFDGSYSGQSRNRAGGVVYQGKSVSSNKNREVEIIQARLGRVSAVTISPEQDLTDYSLPSAVPDGVLDPVAGFSRFLSAQESCPAAFQIYDGRRVVQVVPKSQNIEGAVRTCVMDYQVVLGKGHLSPLYIRHITVTITFDPAIAATGPSLLSLRTGLFAVEFRRI
jgi:hypothetical protein